MEWSVCNALFSHKGLSEAAFLQRNGTLAHRDYAKCDVNFFFPSPGRIPAPFYVEAVPQRPLAADSILQVCSGLFLKITSSHIDFKH